MVMVVLDHRVLDERYVRKNFTRFIASTLDPSVSDEGLQALHHSLVNLSIVFNSHLGNVLLKKSQGVGDPWGAL